MQNNVLEGRLEAQYPDLSSVHQWDYLWGNIFHGGHSLRILAAIELYLLFGSYGIYEVCNRNIFNSM